MDVAPGSKLHARLSRPPETWVDAVMVAIIKDPYFYGALAAGVFLALAIAALVATKVLVAEIDREEREKKRRLQQERKDQ